MTIAPWQCTAVHPDDPLFEGRKKLGSTLDRLIRYGSGVIRDGIRHVEPNMVPVAFCAAIMFPAYWFVWKFLFPQPYENIWVRLFGSMLCLTVALKEWWPKGLQRYLPFVWLLTVLYSGPFFFTFMLLQNNSSTVWLLSTMAGLFLVVLLLDWISLFVLFVIGSLLAWRVHIFLSPEFTAVSLYLEFVPIFLFALTAGTIFNYKAAGMREAQERAERELGMLLAKEMKAPLVAIRTSVASLNKYLSPLIGNYLESEQQKQSGSLIRQLGALERVPARIEDATEQMSSMINLLVMEDRQAGAPGWRASSMLRCLDDALARIPFAAELDRSRIVIDRQYDFLFQGSSVLMRHILARVLEACLNEVYTETGGALLVSLGKDQDRNFVRLTDSSAALRGSPRRIFPSVWPPDRELSSRPDLALAKFVLARVGGSLTHIFSRGRSGEIVLWFPQLGEGRSTRSAAMLSRGRGQPPYKH